MTTIENEIVNLVDDIIADYDNCLLYTSDAADD